MTRLILALLIATPAYADAPCAPLAEITKRITDEFGETRAYVGLADDGNAVQAFANAKTGTWTLLAVAPDGTACVVTWGGGFEAIFKPGQPT